MKRRIFVEKKGIFDAESPKVLNEIKSILPNIQSVKVFNIYDIFGLDESEFEKVVNNTFVAVSYTHLDVYKRQVPSFNIIIVLPHIFFSLNIKLFKKED